MATKKKNPAAVALGRLGGSAPTEKPKGFAAMSKERLREVIEEREAERAIPKADKEKIVRVLSRAYNQMTTEASGKRCISKRARKWIQDDLQEICDWGDERTQIVRLCHLLEDRLEEARKFDITDDVDLLDATKDIVHFGEPTDWRINANLELRFDQ